MKHRYLIPLVLLYSITSCRYFSGKPDYSHLPADTARYLMWCDALKEDSNQAPLLFNRAQYLLGKGYYLKALADANRATILDSSNAQYFNLVGTICYTLNKTKFAATAYERSIELDKEYYESYLKLGELYFYVKEYTSSIRNYNEALRIQPNCDRCYFFKGLCYREMPRRKDTYLMAKDMFEKAIAINPDYYDAYIQLGELHDSANTSLALAYYDAALRIKPRSTEALYHKAFLFQEMGKNDSAGVIYKTITGIDPNYTDAYFNVAYMNMQQKKWQQAIDGFRTVTQISDHAGAYYNLGLCYEQIRDIPKAIEAYRHCLQVNKNHEEAALRLKILQPND